MKPLIEARTRDAEHTAHGLDSELAPMLVDEAVLYSGSLAKYRAVSSTDQCNTAWSLSAGAWNPKVLRGR